MNMKKLISMILVLMFVLSAAALADVITTGNVNIRTAPSLDAGIITSVGTGAHLTYLGNQSTDYRGVVWYNVSYGNRTGWISSRYSYLSGGTSVPQSGTFTATTTAGATTVNGIYYAYGYDSSYGNSGYYVTLDSDDNEPKYWNVRSTPDGSSTTNKLNSAPVSGNLQYISTVPAGYTTSTGNKPSVDWYKVYFNGQTGYVSSRQFKLRSVGSASSGSVSFTTAPSTSASATTHGGVSYPYGYVSSYADTGYHVTLDSDDGDPKYWNVRTSPDGSSTTNKLNSAPVSGNLQYISTVPAGQTHSTGVKPSVEWYQVTFNGQIGYVSSRQFKLRKN